jgi:amidase
MMVEMNLTEEKLEQLREELQDWGIQILDRLFFENDIDILVGVNNHQASIAALANYPALTIPMGYGENGRPIGLTLIAPSFQEQLLIDVGIQFEKLIQVRQGPQNYR